MTAGLAMAAPGSAAPVQSSKADQSMKADDGTLRDRVTFKLDTNANVRKYDIKVKVSDGVATLSGDVATPAQKAEAGRLAKVPGVTSVMNNIAVDPDADKTLAQRTKDGLSKAGENITDAWITTKVHWFFMGEDSLKGSDINVDTNDHVVTLKGTVKTAAGKARAEELAAQTEGVKRVVNNLTVGH